MIVLSGVLSNCIYYSQRTATILIGRFSTTVGSTVENVNVPSLPTLRNDNLFLKVKSLLPVEKIVTNTQQ